MNIIPSIKKAAGQVKDFARLPGRRFCTTTARYGKVIVIFDDWIIVEGDERLQGQKPAVDAESLMVLIREHLGRLSSNDGKEDRVTLVLPPVFFQFTSFELTGIDDNKIREALPLQLPALLPGSTESHLLAFMDFCYIDGKGVSLWMKSELADALVDIFSSQKMLLQAIVPRPIACIQDSHEYVIVEDEDSFQKTIVEIEGKRLLSWYALGGNDLENEEFVSDYNQHRDTLLTSLEDKPEKAASFQQVNSGNIGRSACVSTSCIYFVPDRYNSIQTKKVKSRFIIVLIILLVSVILVVSAPFVMLYFDEVRLDRQLQALKKENKDIVRYAGEVRKFNEKWGVIDDFPNIKMSDLLDKINKLVPKDSWLISLTIDNGILEMTGYSPDPEKILMVFSKQDMFDDVAYSQVVRSEKETNKLNYFGIQCRIKDVDVLAYLDKYFQENNSN